MGADGAGESAPPKPDLARARACVRACAITTNTWLSYMNLMIQRDTDTWAELHSVSWSTDPRSLGPHNTAERIDTIPHDTLTLRNCHDSQTVQPSKCVGRHNTRYVPEII